jgi:2-(1,2-epoxy-1,2-dihydrophenyl)acetyl-CoA isomerase
MTGKRVVLDVAKGIATITLNRPANGNAIDLELARELKLAIHACEKNAGTRAIAIQGRGKFFCSGGDLTAIARAGENAPAYVGELLGHLHEALAAIARIPVPVVAGVHGAAAGAGLSLACACDLAIATRSARFVMAYSRLGLTPDGSASFYLPRVIGLRRALQLALTNRELSAGEALEWGILNEVVEDEQLDGALAALMAQFAKGPSGALGAAKRLMRDSFENTLEGQLMSEKRAICAALDTGDAKEGLSAFLAKRAPDFG